MGIHINVNEIFKSLCHWYISSKNRAKWKLGPDRWDACKNSWWRFSSGWDGGGFEHLAKDAAVSRHEKGVHMLHIRPFTNFTWENKGMVRGIEGSGLSFDNMTELKSTTYKYQYISNILHPEECE